MIMRREGPVTQLTTETALVLFSGGQDSTVCLAWALEQFARVETIGFDYGQRHRVELAARDRLRDRLTALRPEWRQRPCGGHVVVFVPPPPASGKAPPPRVVPPGS